MKILNPWDNRVVKCLCGKYLHYDLTDITIKTCCYDVQSYAGETYEGKFIRCPNCGKEIEVYEIN